MKTILMLKGGEFVFIIKGDLRAKYDTFCNIHTLFREEVKVCGMLVRYFQIIIPPTVTKVF